MARRPDNQAQAANFKLAIGDKVLPGRRSPTLRWTLLRQDGRDDNNNQDAIKRTHSGIACSAWRAQSRFSTPQSFLFIGVLSP